MKLIKRTYIGTLLLSIPIVVLGSVFCFFVIKFINTEETELNITEYEVRLSNAFKLEFNATGECIAIDGNNKQIPDSALASKIVDYVSTNYESAFFTDWDLDTRNQEVELNTGVELIFDLEGNFLYRD